MSFEDRERYGKTEQAIVGTRVFMKVFDKFSKSTTRALSWIIVNDNDKTFVSVNTFDDKIGFNVDTDDLRYPILEDSESKWIKRGYVPMAMPDCPIVRSV